MLDRISGPFSEKSQNQMWRGRTEERNAGESEIVVGEERRTNPALCLSAVLDFLSTLLHRDFTFSLRENETTGLCINCSPVCLFFLEKVGGGACTLNTAKCDIIPM